MRFSTSYSLLAFLGFVAVSVSAVPLSDISRTSVDVNAARPSLKSDSPRFTLTVHRTDDLIDEKAGTFIAERQVEIEMNFDVASTGEGNSLLLNGIPVKAGLSGVEVKVQAEMIINRATVTAPDGTVSEEMEAGVKSAFDLGLVTVEVLVRASTMNVQLNAYLPPVPIRRFSLIERVTEINGKSVVQTDTGGQVFYFGPGGEFVGIVKDAQWGDLTLDEESSMLASQSVQSPSMKFRAARVRSAFSSWFKGLPVALKFLIGCAWATIGFFWGMFLVSSLARLFCKSCDGYVNVDVENNTVTYSIDKDKKMELEAESFGSNVYDDKTPGGGDSENDELCK